MTLALEYMGATNGFVLGRSRIGLDKLDADAIAEWLPAICDVLNVAVNRGGQRDGLVDSLDVGTMTATFLDAMDPTTDDNVRPNTPIRLVDTDVANTPVLTWPATGAALNALWRMGIDDGASYFIDAGVYWLFPVRGPSLNGRMRTVATVPVCDALTVRWTARAEVNLASAPPDLQVTYAVTVGREVRLFTATPTTESHEWTIRAAHSGPVAVSVHIVETNKPTTNAGAFVTGVTMTADTDAPIFTGVVQDVTMVDDRDGRRRVTLTAVDARASLSNTQRYGAISDAGAGFETWAQRINRLRASAQTSTAAPKVTGGASPFLLRDVVYESTLANHLDLACNSVGARWWVDRRNLVQFEYGPPGSGPVIAHLSDEHDADDPMHVCYLDVELGYDTRNAINNLSLTNHGRRFDTEQATWLADDQTSVHEDVTAIASWGARSSSVDTSLYVGAGHEADVVIRAYQLLDGAVVPSVRPTSVRLDVTHGPHILADLDYYSRVTLTRAGTTWVCRVVGIEHEITPLDGHHITLTLREDT